MYAGTRKKKAIHLGPSALFLPETLLDLPLYQPDPLRQVVIAVAIRCAGDIPKVFF
jgi:hypothetical protein